jgi:hypothetical protein
MAMAGATTASVTTAVPAGQLSAHLGQTPTIARWPRAITHAGGRTMENVTTAAKGGHNTAGVAQTQLTARVLGEDEVKQR